MSSRPPALEERTPACNLLAPFECIRLTLQWKSDHYAAAAARNLNTAFEDGSVSKRTIRYWYAKFESGDESHNKRLGQASDSCGQRSPKSDS
ncbi:hypothetical protein TNCT_174571 [Trichonephila clavata]|uniref:Mos1 transposase HTH domain-containing protein n=1 Tax=Trichonephila clavata TaxID=2740835 RepID=A0A8X6KHW9_TRICU|nr:hypothetical protein TNCT_174571 [Trichonephila clavata]